MQIKTVASLIKVYKICYFTEEFIANLTSIKKELDVTVSGVLSYNIQNDAVHGNRCGNIFGITNITSTLLFFSQYWTKIAKTFSRQNSANRLET